MESENPTEEELLIELGRAIAEDRSPGLPIDARESIHLAKAFFKNQRSKLQELVCNSEHVKGLVADERLSHAVAILIDILSQEFTRLPCAVIARLLLMQGLLDFCANHWNESQEIG